MVICSWKNCKRNDHSVLFGCKYEHCMYKVHKDCYFEMMEECKDLYGKVFYCSRKCKSSCTYYTEYEKLEKIAMQAFQTGGEWHRYMKCTSPKINCDHKEFFPLPEMGDLMRAFVKTRRWMDEMGVMDTEFIPAENDTVCDYYFILLYGVNGFQKMPRIQRLEQPKVSSIRPEPKTRRKSKAKLDGVKDKWTLKHPIVPMRTAMEQAKVSTSTKTFLDMLNQTRKSTMAEPYVITNEANRVSTFKKPSIAANEAARISTTITKPSIAANEAARISTTITKPSIAANEAARASTSVQQVVDTINQTTVLTSAKQNAGTMDQSVLLGDGDVVKSPECSDDTAHSTECSNDIANNTNVTRNLYDGGYGVEWTEGLYDSVDNANVLDDDVEWKESEEDTQSLEVTTSKDDKICAELNKGKAAEKEKALKRNDVKDLSKLDELMSRSLNSVENGGSSVHAKCDVSVESLTQKDEMEVGEKDDKSSKGSILHNKDEKRSAEVILNNKDAKRLKMSDTNDMNTDHQTDVEYEDKSGMVYENAMDDLELMRMQLEIRILRAKAEKMEAEATTATYEQTAALLQAREMLASNGVTAREIDECLPLP